MFTKKPVLAEEVVIEPDTQTIEVVADSGPESRALFLAKEGLFKAHQEVVLWEAELARIVESESVK